MFSRGDWGLREHEARPLGVEMAVGGMDPSYKPGGGGRYLGVQKSSSELVFALNVNSHLPDAMEG